MIKLLKPQKVNRPKILSFSVHSFLSNLIYLDTKDMSNLILSYSNSKGDKLNPFYRVNHADR